MFFLLIFPVLVAGFVACHIHPVHSYHLHRYEGQYLYLKSAELGLTCFLIGGSVALALHYWVPDSITIWCRSFSWQLLAWLTDQMTMAGAGNPKEASRMAWFVELSFLTYIAAYLLKFWGHFRLWLRFKSWETRVYVIGELLYDSPLDNLLFSLSLDEKKNVMLTMEDRKVYVGRIINLGEPSATGGMDQDVLLIPFISGYRDKDDLKVTFTTRYSEVEAEIVISLRQDNIVSATEFDVDAYHMWNPPEAEKPAGAPGPTPAPAPAAPAKPAAAKPAVTKSLDEKPAAAKPDGKAGGKSG